ncbi:ABC transporter ATP-binding protein [Peribacillus alkalitolerans]|uniref:ABC transporter ATP-binding protein n=1 Tax=Peribacillus alkalitolerans TaxID=1550385 RepID=UPI0013D7FE9F|nr:ABC transporter ATP-binding protein [Peribacillus alkalitolerans]
MNGTVLFKELLSIRDLRTSFYEGNTKKEAVRGVSFSIEKGEVLGIVGESGSGKSIMMKSILGLLPQNAKVDEGEIILNGKHVDGMSKKDLQKIRGREIAMIFQDPMTALNPLKKVGDHIIDLLVRIRGLNKKQARIEAVEVIRSVGIPSPEQRLNQYPHEFSGGMRQRVLVAMALACQPELLIADEPTTALDVTIQAQILQLLKSLRQNNDMAIALITHDLGVVASLCSRIIVMYAGQIMEEGTAEEIFYDSKHPYTKALLNSIPKLNEVEKQRLRPIKGTAPSLTDQPKGCPFASRCEFSFNKCFSEDPSYQAFSSTQRSKCWIANEVGETNE